MKNLLRKLSRVRVTHSANSVLQSDSPDSVKFADKKGSDVPEGHFPVYVGIDSTKRFVVSAELLGHPVFIALLDRSAQEYGYEQRGVLRIPINVVVFERFLESLSHG